LAPFLLPSGQEGGNHEKLTKEKAGEGLHRVPQERFIVIAQPFREVGAAQKRVFSPQESNRE